MRDPIAHGGAPRGFLEFSANLRPGGMPAAIRRAVARASVDAYADLDVSRATTRLARDAGVDPSEVQITAGATEGLRLAASALLCAGGSALVAGPSYGEYARVARRALAAVDEIRAAPPDFPPPVARLIERVRADRPTLLCVCDPNNPTGRQLEPDALRSLVEALPRGTTLVLDQSFAPFAPPTLAARELIANPNVVLVRSLTKVLAAPGLRLGYVVAHADLVARLAAARDPWAVGAHAIAAAAVARFALSVRERARIERWRDRLASALRALGLRAVPSAANFLLVEVGDGAAALCARLSQRRIAVRHCADFALMRYVRIAVRPPRQQDALLDALDAIRAEIGW